jgi:hypothetical protein
MTSGVNWIWSAEYNDHYYVTVNAYGKLYLISSAVMAMLFIALTFVGQPVPVFAQQLKANPAQASSSTQGSDQHVSDDRRDSGTSQEQECPVDPGTVSEKSQ